LGVRAIDIVAGKGQLVVVNDPLELS